MYLLMMSICLNLCASFAARHDFHTRVVNGTEASIADWPFIVSLRKRSLHTCGGSIIAENYVVTAGHCFDDSDLFAPWNFQVLAGVDFLLIDDPNGILNDVIKVTRHEDYSGGPSGAFNDITLLLVEPFSFLEDDNPNVQPIAVSSASHVPAGTLCTVAGFGAIEQGSGVSFQLLEAAIPLLAPRVCCEKMRKLSLKRGDPLTFSTEKEVCTLSPEGEFRDACQGDSGGPLICNGRLYGIVSWGIGCAKPDSPGVYARVDAYKDWMSRVMTERHSRVTRLPSVGQTKLARDESLLILPFIVNLVAWKLFE